MCPFRYSLLCKILKSFAASREELLRDRISFTNYVVAKQACTEHSGELPCTRSLFSTSVHVSNTILYDDWCEGLWVSAVKVRITNRGHDISHHVVRDHLSVLILCADLFGKMGAEIVGEGSDFVARIPYTQFGSPLQFVYVGIGSGCLAPREQNREAKQENRQPTDAPL